MAATGLPGTVGEYSWGGAAATYFFNDPKEDLAVVFMTQVLFAPDRIKLRRDLRTLVYGAMTESFCVMIREEFDITAGTARSRRRPAPARRAALEHGQLLYFPSMPFQLSNSETEFLDGRLTDGKAKNISLDHTSGKLQGTSATGERAERLAAMIERFGAGATRFVKDLLPNYASVERARTSYRPVEVEGRRLFGDPGRPAAACRCLSLAADEEWPAHPALLRQCRAGKPDGGGSRHWEVGEPFADFAAQIRARHQAAFPRQELALRKAGRDAGPAHRL